ncbi:hypothetical protein AK812_SmicGene5045 [Symbiodinium microadriaticum]|uniref:Uncharacterized protein n=1 Tax=Symbiodinium microadriaticum TaxID=2951 RepID=A0A1Q9EUR2_SYMMI|nr:hypothetical protein AK812_SmicGene5045 [Symbiodinium microadriaticum]
MENSMYIDPGQSKKKEKPPALQPELEMLESQDRFADYMDFAQIARSVSLRTATSNFIYSMAASGPKSFEVLHVDFGFMLCGAPGGKDFRSAIQDGMKAVRAHAQEL